MKRNEFSAMGAFPTLAFVANESQAVVYFATDLARDRVLIVTLTPELAKFTRALALTATNAEANVATLTERATPNRFDWLRLARLAHGSRALHISSTFSAAHQYMSLGQPAGTYSYFDDGLATYTMGRVRLRRSRLLRHFSARIRLLEMAEKPLGADLFSSAHLYYPDSSHFPGRKQKIDGERYRAVVEFALGRELCLLPNISERRFVLLVLGGKGFDFDFSYTISLISRLNRVGHFVVVKPHPRHDAAKLAENVGDGATVVSARVPIEMLFGRHKGSIVSVIGPPTTALLTASTVYGLKTFYIWPADDAELRVDDFVFSDCGAFLDTLDIRRWDDGVTF